MERIDSSSKTGRSAVKQSEIELRLPVEQAKQLLWFLETMTETADFDDERALNATIKTIINELKRKCG